MPTKWLQERTNGSKNEPGIPPLRAFCGVRHVQETEICDVHFPHDLGITPLNTCSEDGDRPPRRTHRPQGRPHPQDETGAPVQEPHDTPPRVARPPPLPCHQAFESGFGVQGLGFRDWGVAGVQGLGLRFQISGFRVSDLGFRVQGLELRVQG